MRKILATLLAAALLFTAIPFTAFADSEDSVLQQLEIGDTVNNDFIEAPTDTEVIIYNLGKAEVSVDVEDDYTIQLEDNAFFPYEIQFQYKGNTTVEVFDTPDSTVNIGGHAISVTSNYDDDAISQIGVWVDGEYIPAMPEKKTFTNGMQLFSLLPITTSALTLDLRHLPWSSNLNITVSAIIAGIDPQQNFNGKTVLWNYIDSENYYEDSYELLERFTPIPGGSVNIGEYEDELIFIVGSGNQLDMSATKYIVDIVKFERPYIEFEFFTEENSTRAEVAKQTYRPKALDPNSGASTSGGDNEYVRISVPSKYTDVTEFYLNMEDAYGYLAGYDVKVYKGRIANQSELSGAEDITSDIWGKDMSQLNTGYKANYYTKKEFTIVAEKNGSVVWMCPIDVNASSRGSSVEFGSNAWYQAPDNTRTRVSAYWSRGIVTGGGANNYGWRYQEIVGSLGGTVSLDKDVYINFIAYSGVDGIADNNGVEMAVVGHYYTPQEAIAAGEPDIKSDLMVENGSMSSQNVGYRISLNTGTKITIFYGNTAYQFDITADANSDASFDITGAGGISSSDVYIMQAKDDSGAQQFGYRTVLIKSASADLSSLKPTFYVRSTSKVYAENEPQVSGERAHDFSNNRAVHYSVVAENGVDESSYWVSFAKVEAGIAKLFVVLDGEKPEEREVFLADYTNNQHDIFIANVGSEELTGLRAEIRNAVNVKIDDYWKIGGQGNDSLAGFTSVGNGYGESENVAKIRLVADGVGEVSGTLVISSDNGGFVEITLTGAAGNPTITTEQADFDRVKSVEFVPYEFKIMDNNKYKFNDAVYTLEAGNLPSGIGLSPSGVIYGVPKEFGTFNFRVRMTNSYSEFATVYKSFTLTVYDNQKVHVDSTIDPGYRILNRVGGDSEIVTSYQNTLFRSEGAFNEFVDFWIDGEKQTLGVDYTANEGSTAITILASTFQKYGTGEHTIAAEFRVGGDASNDLKRTSQNYTSTVGNTSGDTDDSSDSSSSSNANNTTTVPTINAVAAAQSSAQSANKSLPKLTMKLRNVDLISLSELKEIAAIAAKEGKTPWLVVDTVSPNTRTVDVRVSINPALATKALNLAGSTTSARAIETKNLFEKYFRNRILAVISLSQKSEFGQQAEICVKVAPETRVEELILYSYNPETNSYREIRDANAWIDKNNYLHFSTNYANEIVISEGRLERR